MQESAERTPPQRRVWALGGSTKYRCQVPWLPHLAGPASWYRRAEMVFERLPWRPARHRSSRSAGPDPSIRSSRFLPLDGKKRWFHTVLPPLGPDSEMFRKPAQGGCGSWRAARGLGAGRVPPATSSRAVDNSCGWEMDGSPRK